MKIEYKGKTLETKNFCEVTEEERQQLYNDYFSRPSLETVQEQNEKNS